MAFTSWSALRTDIKDKIATYVAGTPLVGEYAIGPHRLKYRNIQEITDLLTKTFELESLESAGDVGSRVTYGRHRRFR